MSATKQEIRDFLDSIESDTVAINDEGMCLVEIGPDGHETGNYFEIGGHTPPDADEEEQ